MGSIDHSDVDRRFQAALGDLIRAAEREGIDLQRARDIAAASDDYRWMIEITRVESPDDRRDYQ